MIDEVFVYSLDPSFSERSYSSNGELITRLREKDIRTVSFSCHFVKSNETNCKYLA